MRTVKGLVLALLAACGGGQDPAAQQSPVTETPVTETPADTTAEAPEQPTPPEEKPLPPPPKKLSLEEKVALQKQCFADWLKEDASFFERCYADNAVMTHMDGMMGPQKGRAAIAENTKHMWDAFTLDGELKVVLASGNTIASIGVLTGTNDGPMMNTPPTKKKFGAMFAEVFTLDDQGKVTEWHLYHDPATMMAHLGIAKVPARPVAKKSGGEPVVVMAGETDAEKANVELIRGVLELVNARDAKALGAKYDAKAVFSEQSMKADVKGQKKITASAAEWFKAFPDAQEEATTMLAAGDYVFVESHMTGTNKGASKSMGIKKATGKSVDLHAAHVFKIANGKITEHWVFSNGMAFGMQLGLMQPPAMHKDHAAPAGDAPPKGPPAKDK